MIYNFDEVIDRVPTNAEKWVDIPKRFGRDGLIPLWLADMDFKTAKPIIDEIGKRVAHGIFGYTSISDDYLDAVCGFQERTKDWQIDKELISLGLGVVPSICMIIREITEPGCKIIIQTPVYHPFFKAVTNAGRQLVECPLLEADGSFIMDFEGLEKQAKQGAKYILLCSPHNPIGRVWTREELLRLGDLCLEYGIKVISDEIHSDLVLWGNRHIPFASLSEQLNRITITCFAVSKTFNLAGLQSCIVVFPDRNTKRIFDKAWAKLHTEVTNCLSLTATLAAYRYGDEWLKQLISYLEGNVSFLMDYFNKNIRLIKPICPQATYMVWLDCRKLGMNAEELMNFMVAKAGLGLNNGAQFGKPGEGFMRMNVACPRSILEKALKQLEEAVSKL